MSIAQMLIGELKLEAVGTRKTLERVPAADLDWRPHPKSFNMGTLASHVAEIPSWASSIVNDAGLDFDPATFKPWIGKSGSELVARFDECVEKALAALDGKPDERFFEQWTFSMKGQVVFAQPKIGVMRGMVLNHLVHHRGQLTVYLRMRDVPLPALYGPSADEKL